MTKFIRGKLASIAVGTLISAVVVVLSMVAVYFGSSLLGDSPLMGSLLVSLAPLGIYLTAFFYQSSVIYPVRLLSIEPVDNLTSFERMVLKSAKESYNFSKWIPMVITGFAAFMSVTFVPGILGQYAIESQMGFEQAVFSMLIAANFVLFIRMSDQVVAARNSLKFT